MSTCSKVTRRVVGAYLATVAACVGVAVSAFILVGLTLIIFVEGGLSFRPDGGDEIWSRPNVFAYLPPALVGIGLTWLLARRLRRRFTRIGAYIGAYVYASHMHEPGRFLCGNTYPYGHIPGLVVPGLVAAYLAAIVGSAILTGIARRTA